MKIFQLLVLTIISLMFLIGCENDCWEDDCDPHGPSPVDHPPAVPTGFYSVTGDGEVRLYWDHNQESDLDGYNVYWNDQAHGWFEFMSFTKNTYYIDRAVGNGQTYFYAIAAVDYNGNESELTYEDIFDTPRPEGYNLRLYTFNGDEYDQEHSGWDFDFELKRHWEDPRTDMYYEYIWDEDNQRSYHYLNVSGNDVRIQPWGYIDSMDEIDWAPETDWTDREWVELDEDMAYVLKIRKPEQEIHYAKIHIRDLDSGVIRLDWAYQIDPGNPELIITPKPIQRTKQE